MSEEGKNNDATLFCARPETCTAHQFRPATVKLQFDPPLEIKWHILMRDTLCSVFWRNEKVIVYFGDIPSVTCRP